MRELRRTFLCVRTLCTLFVLSRRCPVSLTRTAERRVFPVCAAVTFGRLVSTRLRHQVRPRRGCSNLRQRRVDPLAAVRAAFVPFEMLAVRFAVSGWDAVDRRQEPAELQTAAGPACDKRDEQRRRGLRKSKLVCLVGHAACSVGNGGICNDIIGCARSDSSLIMPRSQIERRSTLASPRPGDEGRREDANDKPSSCRFGITQIISVAYGISCASLINPIAAILTINDFLTFDSPAS